MKSRTTARRTGRTGSRLLTFVLGFIVVLAAVGAYRSGLLGESTALSSRLMSSRSPHNDARATADRLRDTPECAKYRAAILAERGKTGERAQYAIEQAYKDGKAANCLKMDVE